MTDQPTPAELVAQATEAVRQLNRATLWGAADALPYPGDVSSTVGGLRELVQRLPQTVAQLQQRLDELAADGHVRSDAGEADLPVRLEETRAELAEAAAKAEALARSLGEAHSHLAHLGYQD